MFNPDKLEPEGGTREPAQSVKRIEAGGGKPEFGKVAEGIELDFFKKEMRNVFPDAVHASEKGDKTWKVDLIVQLMDGSHLGIQSCIAEDYRILLKKAQDLVNNPLIGIEKIHPSPGGQNKEEVPKVLLVMKENDLQEAFYKRGVAGQGEISDFLPDKKKLKINILQQMISCLTQQLIGHPAYKKIIEPKINILNKEACELMAAGS